MPRKLGLLPAFLILLILGAARPNPAPAQDLPEWWDQAQVIARQDGYRLLSAPQLKALYDKKDDFLVLDVRPDYEYHSGHLPQARNLEFHLGDRARLSEDKAAALKELLGPDLQRRIIIYCRSFR